MEFSFYFFPSSDISLQWFFIFFPSAKPGILVRIRQLYNIIVIMRVPLTIQNQNNSESKFSVWECSPLCRDFLMFPIWAVLHSLVGCEKSKGALFFKFIQLLGSIFFNKLHFSDEYLHISPPLFVMKLKTWKNKVFTMQRFNCMTECVRNALLYAEISSCSSFEQPSIHPLNCLMMIYTFDTYLRDGPFFRTDF